jgi:hypothetical protein
MKMPALFVEGKIMLDNMPSKYTRIFWVGALLFCGFFFLTLVPNLFLFFLKSTLAINNNNLWKLAINIGSFLGKFSWLWTST